jgi:RNA polymerase sigma factor (sigma-70 family)
MQRFPAWNFHGRMIVEVPDAAFFQDTPAMTSQTQPKLLERLRDAADPLAWDEFFERYWRLIHGYARRRGCSEHTSEEIVQEVMLAVFERRDVFQYDPARGRFRDWLSRIVRNHVVRRRRRPAERIRAPGGHTQENAAELTDDGPPPEILWQDAFEQSLLLILLDMVRRSVTPRTYQAFELFALHELPGEDVARLTGLSRNAVYQARKAVLQRLKELGASYRETGRLGDRVKAALASRPAAAVQRSMTTRIVETMQSR